MSSSSSVDDPDIEKIKARKLKELREKAAAIEKMKNSNKQQQPQKQKSPQEIVSSYLYDRGNEVLNMAYSQFPTQTAAVVARIAELITSGEINNRISGGELLSLFRSIGLNIRLNTTIKVEDHGKLVTFSDKLKMNEDL
jgi:DNA-binding TFAR19-related protein (PDSD5 family)